MLGDDQLVRRIADGDENALQELLRRYQSPLSSFLFRHTGGRDVEDLYQETWLRVVKHAGSFDPSKRFSTWLFQIAVNLCRDWYRRHTSQESEIETSASSTRGLERVEAALDATALLALLPDNQREVMILRYYHDLSEAEMADILECPRGTIKSRLHQGLARMNAAWKTSASRGDGAPK